MLEFLKRGGDEDAIDNLVYSLREAEQPKVAKAFLRKPRKPDRWREVQQENECEDDVLVEAGET